jgi:predicted RND superfamily exporter protein
MQALYILLLIACGGFYGAARGQAKRNVKQYRDQQRELLKWQQELEKKSSDLRRK